MTRIMNNAAAGGAHRALAATQDRMTQALEKLSSGSRINRAGDDAAGLVISEALRSQVNGTRVAIRNAQDGISMVQTAEGALVEVHAMLQRMRDLTVQAVNGTQSPESRAAAHDEFVALRNAINDVGAFGTRFNGIFLLGGLGATTAPTAVLQTGAAAGETLTVTLALVSSDHMGRTAPGAPNLSSVDLRTATGSALAIVDQAVLEVSRSRAGLGATQNRLEHVIANLSVTAENLAMSESRIRDTDMAATMTAFTRSQVLAQAGTAMLAQANAAPQGVLQLLRG